MRRDAIERLLPAAFARAATPGSVLGALLDVMEALPAPGEAVLDSVDDLFDAYRAPDAFVAFLAGWVALEDVLGQRAPGGAPRLPVPIGRVRNLVAESAALASWRGTPRGLRMLLETMTGVPGFVVEEPAGRPFHVRVHVPADAAPYLDLVTRVVRTAKPAATTCDVVQAA